MTGAALKFRQITGTLLILLILFGEILALAPVFNPPPARAFSLGSLSTFLVGELDWYQVLKDVAEGVLRGAVQTASKKFLNDFVSKITEKYKIRNYLYYDKILSDYYLNQYIQDKITDPDLQRAYQLLESAYVSGAPTGTNGAPDPRNALIPQIKKAMSDYYISQGGIDPTKISNPATFATDGDFFDAQIAYASNPQGFTAQNLQGNFGAFQSSATTSSQLEIAVGNGLKAGRYIGGICNMPSSGTTSSPPATGSLNTIPQDPQSCAAARGHWQEPALDEARSFIDNPTTFISQNLDSAIKQHLDNNFDPNNFWVQLGTSLGNSLINDLGLNKSTGTLNEDPNDPYNPLSGSTDYSIPSQDQIDAEGEDLDNDGIVDAYDINGDGIIDTCAFYGTPPDGCITSSGATGQTPPDGGNAAPADWLKHGQHADTVIQVIQTLTAQGDDLTGPCGAFDITKHVAWLLRNDPTGQAGLTKDSGANSCNGYASSVIMYPDGYSYNILLDPGGANTPQWAWNGSLDPSTNVPAFNPDPSCPATSPLQPLMFGLGDVKSQVIQWNVGDSANRVSQTGITEDQLQSFDDEIDQVEGQDPAAPYHDQIEQIQTGPINSLEALFGLFGPFRDQAHVFSAAEKQNLATLRTSLLSGLNNLMQTVAADCNP